MSEKVIEPSAAYTDMESEWQKCRDAIAGQKAVHKRGETYLPKLSGQEKDSYQKYLKQALFYNATGRTFRSYVGMIFRKDPQLNGPDAIREFADNVDREGHDLDEFARSVVEEELTTTRVGILVDHPRTDGRQMTVEQAEAEGIRPYLVKYDAEQILKVKVLKIGNDMKLSQVRLKETYEKQTDDEFAEEEGVRVRVLDLARVDENSSQVAYRQRVFVKDENGWAEDEQQRSFPRMNGQYIDEIPFFMPGGWEMQTPELIDLVDVNLSHYIAEADHRRGVAWTTRPQPWGTGVDSEELDDLVMGGEELWHSRHENAQFGMLEYSGSGLSASEKLIEKLEHRMSVLGARMLLESNTNDETATEIVIKKQGENSALSDVAGRVGKAITDALQFTAEWQNIPNVEEIEYALNKDYIPVSATPDDVLKMIQAVQTGEYSREDFHWWLEQSEVVDPSVDRETRISNMETNAPAGLIAGNVGSGGMV